MVDTGLIYSGAIILASILIVHAALSRIILYQEDINKYIRIAIVTVGSVFGGLLLADIILQMLS